MYIYIPVATICAMQATACQPGALSFTLPCRLVQPRLMVRAQLRPHYIFPGYNRYFLGLI